MALRPDRLGGALTLAAALAACGPRGPTLVAEWRGADAGRVRAPATAQWCAAARVLVVQGVSNDSGVALALRPAGDTLEAGRYPLTTDTAAPPRPSAMLAARWVHLKKSLLVQVRLDGGDATLALAGGRASVVAAGQVPLPGTDSLVRLAVEARDVPVSADTAGCPAPPPPPDSVAAPAADSGVS